MKRFWDKVKKTGGCWLWLGADDGMYGYGRFRLGGRTRSAPRVAWELTHGAIPAGQKVLHRCDNPRCVRPAHLFLGTDLDNMRDMQAKGRERKARGVFNGRAKLDSERVRLIRKRLAAGDRQVDIAAAVGVSQTVISAIKRGQKWRHVA